MSRLPDFRLSHAWLRLDDGEELVRYNTAIVEVKLCTEKTVMKSKLSYKQLINKAINNMAPQVIEAVQVAFAERPDQEEIVAIPTVNSFCRFVYFTRSTLLPLNLAMANQGRGFQDRDGTVGRKLYDTYGRRATQTVQMMSGGGVFFDAKKVRKYAGKAKGIGKRKVVFGDAFVSHWNDFVKWTRRKDLFPHPDEQH